MSYPGAEAASAGEMVAVQTLDVTPDCLVPTVTGSSHGGPVNQIPVFSTALIHLHTWPNELPWCEHLICCAQKDHCHWQVRRAALLCSSIPHSSSSCLYTDRPRLTPSATYKRAAIHTTYLRNTSPGRKPLKLLEGKSERPQS